MTKILHGCLDGIRTVPSNGKIMLIVKNMLGQETFYSTHSPKNGYYSQFAFFRTYAYYSHCYGGYLLK